MTSDDLLASSFSTEREQLLLSLKSLSIVDIGFVERIYADGSVQVASNQYVGGQRVIYDHAELVFPGNQSSVFSADCSGCPCLIFIPRTCVPHINTRTVKDSSLIYDKAGTKVMPIGTNTKKAGVNANLDSLGNLHIYSNTYDVYFSKDSVSLSQGTLLSLAKDAEGNLQIYRKNEVGGKAVLALGDEGLVSQCVDTTGKVSWTNQINPDGTASLTLKNENGEDDDQDKIAVVIDTEGTVTLRGKVTVTIDKDGNISLDTEGKVEVSAKDAVTLSAEETLDVSSKKAVTISSDDNISITAGSNKDVNANGNSKTLVTYAALNQALTTLCTKIANHTHVVSTTGSAAAQTGTAAVSLDLSGLSPGISNAEAKHLKTS